MSVIPWKQWVWKTLDPVLGASRLHNPLQCFRSNVTDATRSNRYALNGLIHLKVLFLSDTNITGSGLAHLEQLKSLHWLDLEGSRIIDAELTHLQRVPALESLILFQYGDDRKAVAAALPPW
jgi:hypothetical protein